jgi:hypothetical protein
MIILDTNVFSEFMRPRPNPDVIAWLDRQPRTSVWITSITLLEIRYGLQSMPPGKRRTALLETFDSLLADKISGRVAPFDSAAAENASELMAFRHKKGQPADWRDTMIAGIVLATHATLATRNTAHFQDAKISVANPWIE